jgi:hypothetical protein
MQGIIPADVQWRTDKSNIGASLKIDLLKYGYRELDDAVATDSPLAEYLDMNLLKQVYREYQSDTGKDDKGVLLMLTSVYLSSWLKQEGFNWNGTQSVRSVDVAA